jgi:hypothetical protein
MAINAPIILPDPVGNYLETFKTFDTSARDRERIAMEQDRLVQAKIQQMRLNKADDFNLMMNTLNRQDKLKQESVSNEFKERELGLLTKYRQQELVSRNYGNLTARYNALNPKSGSGSKIYDPQGLFGRAGSEQQGPVTDLSLPGDPPNTSSSFTDGAVPPVNSGEPDLPLGGPPEGNLLGEPPPVGGPAANLFPSPESGTLPPMQPTTNAPSETRQQAESRALATPDLPPAAPDYFKQQSVNEYFGTPSAEVPPMEPPSQTPAPASGPHTIQGTLGGLFATPPQTAPPVSPAPPISLPPAAPAAPAPIPPAPFTDGSLPPAAPAQGDAALMYDSSTGVLPSGEVALKNVGPQQPISLTTAPIDQQTNNTLKVLLDAQDKLKAEITMTKINAERTARDLRIVAKNPNGEGVPEYTAKLDKLQADYISKSTQAADFENKVKEAQAYQKVIAERQQALRTIGGDLAKVLPYDAQQTLIKEASDPSTAAADNRIKELAEYNRLRAVYKMNHQSNGLETASEVARIGKSMTTAEALGEKKAAKDYFALEELMKTIDKTPENQERLKKLQSEQDKLYGRKLGYEDRELAFKAAVDADTRVAPTRPQEAQQAPAPELQSAGNPRNLDFKALMGDNSTLQAQAAKNEEQSKANDFWTEGKNRAAELSKLSNATNEALAMLASNAVPPSPPLTEFDLGTNARIPYPLESLANKISSGFVMPKGQGDVNITGRYGEVTVSDFLQAAAQDELDRRRSEGRKPGDLKALSSSDEAALSKLKGVDKK